MALPQPLGDLSKPLDLPPALRFTRGKIAPRRLPLAQAPLEARQRALPVDERGLHVLPAIGDGKAPAPLLELEAVLSQPAVELAPRASLLEIITCHLSYVLAECFLAGSLNEAPFPARQANAPVAILTRQGVVPALHRLQAELALLLPEAPFDPGVVEVGSPEPAGRRVDSIEHDVHVLVPSVVVGDHEGLVLLEPEILERAVDDTEHRLSIEPLVRRETDGEVVDGLLGASVLSRKSWSGSRRSCAV